MQRRTITALIGGFVVAGTCLNAVAEMKENPYQIIIDRNPFGLREPPPPPAQPTNEPPPAPPLDIKLTGISTLLGPPKVFLEFTDPQSKKVDRPSAMLEGETYNGKISIVKIDPENNRVQVKVGDAESWLDFDKNGHKPGGSVAAAAPTPGVPVVPGVPRVPTPNPTPAAGAAATAQPAGPARGALVGGVSAAATTPAPYNNTAMTTASSLPPRPLRGAEVGGAALIGGVGTQPAATPAPPKAPSMTHEQAQAIIEARRLQLQQQGNPMSRILPPTPLGQQLQNGGPPAPGQ